VCKQFPEPGFILPYGLLHPVLVTHVPEDQDHSQDVPSAVPDGRTGIRYLVLMTVPGQEPGMVGQPDNLPGAQDLVHRIVRFLSGPGIDNGKYLIQGLARGLFQAPAGQGFGHRVHPGDPALGVCGDDPVPDGLQGHPQAFFIFSDGPLCLFSFGDVLHEGHAAHGLSPVVGDGGCGQADIDQSSVFCPPNDLESGKAAFSKYSASNGRGFVLLFLRDKGQGPADDFRGSPAQDLLGGRVPG
jgi:hypothetical protein